MIEDIIFSLLLLGLSIAFHEFGHFDKAERLGLKPVYKSFCVTTIYDGRLIDRVKVLKAGILLGLIPVVASIFLVPKFCGVLAVIYVFGCKDDIKQLIKIRRRNKK